MEEKQGMMRQECVRIISNEPIAKATWRMRLAATMAQAMKPGQFVNIRIDGFTLRRPISISSIEEDGFVIVYKVVGEGTAKLAALQAGQPLDVFGPLGSSYPLHAEEKEVLLIGGGVGVPPLYELAKQYRRLGSEVYVALGFADKESVFYENAFAALGCHVAVATMDGSYGVAGTVIDAIKANKITADFTCSCGPVPMLKAVESVYQRGYMSFEARMACGIGACMACVAKDRQEADLYHRICKEGPVFPIGKVEY